MLAVKKPIPVKVIEFTGKKDVQTLEGPAYSIDGSTHYILQGVGGEQWPIAKDIFKKTYDIVSGERHEFKEPLSSEYLTEGFIHILTEWFKIDNLIAKERYGDTVLSKLHTFETKHLKGLLKFIKKFKNEDSPPHRENILRITPVYELLIREIPKVIKEKENNE